MSHRVVNSGTRAHSTAFPFINFGQVFDAHHHRSPPASLDNREYTLLWRIARRLHHTRCITQQRVDIAAAVAMHKAAPRGEHQAHATLHAKQTHLKNELLTLMLRSQSRFDTRAERACAALRHNNAATVRCSSARLHRAARWWWTRCDELWIRCWRWLGRLQARTD